VMGLPDLLSFADASLRTHIADALSRKSKGVQGALSEYNDAATALGKATVAWKRVSVASHISMVD